MRSARTTGVTAKLHDAVAEIALLARLDQLRKSIEEHDFNYEGTHLKVTVTIGVAEYRQGDSIDEWIDSADMKLYEGKRSGKNRVVS